MELKDLIEGEVYKATFLENPKGIIFKWEGKFFEGCKYVAINLYNNSLLINGYLTAPLLNNFKIIKTTDLEKQWLEECIATNHYVVPPVEVNSNDLFKSLVIW